MKKLHKFAGVLLIALSAMATSSEDGSARASDDLLKIDPLNIICEDYVEIDFGDPAGGAIHHMAPLDRTAVALFVLGYFWGETGQSETFRIVRYAPEIMDMVCLQDGAGSKTLIEALRSNRVDVIERLRPD